METVTEVTTLVSETETEEIVTTVSAPVDLDGIDYTLVNHTCELIISFIIACLFWWVCKYLYRLFKIFF